MPSPPVKDCLSRLKTEVRALGLAFRDPRTPWVAKAVLGLVVAFIVSPIDPIPDFIPVIGYLDDLIVLALGVWLAVRLVPARVLADCRARAAEAGEGKTAALGWLGAALVVVLWAAVLAGAVWAVRLWRNG